MHKHIYTHTYIHTFIYTYIHTDRQTNTFTPIHSHTHKLIISHIYTHTLIRIFTCMYPHTHIHTFIHMDITHTYIHSHVYTHIHTNTHFFLIDLYWTIIASQYCVSFCCTTKQISHMHAHVPIYPPYWAFLPSSLSHPSRSSQSTEPISLCYAAASHQPTILHSVVCICRCYSHLAPALPSHPTSSSPFSMSTSLFLPYKLLTCGFLCFLKHTRLPATGPLHMHFP